jgi:hypothetical protein
MTDKKNRVLEFLVAASKEEKDSRPIIKILCNAESHGVSQIPIDQFWRTPGGDWLRFGKKHIMGPPTNAWLKYQKTTKQAFEGNHKLSRSALMKRYGTLENLEADYRSKYDFICPECDDRVPARSEKLFSIFDPIADQIFSQHADICRLDLITLRAILGR